MRFETLAASLSLSLIFSLSFALSHSSSASQVSCVLRWLYIVHIRIWHFDQHETIYSTRRATSNCSQLTSRTSFFMWILERTYTTAFASCQAYGFDIHACTGHIISINSLHWSHCAHILSNRWMCSFSNNNNNNRLLDIIFIYWLIDWTWTCLHWW